MRLFDRVLGGIEKNIGKHTQREGLGKRLSFPADWRRSPIRSAQATAVQILALREVEYAAERGNAVVHSLDGKKTTVFRGQNVGTNDTLAVIERGIDTSTYYHTADHSSGRRGRRTVTVRETSEGKTELIF